MKTDDDIIEGFKDYHRALNRLGRTILAFYSNLKCFRNWMDAHGIAAYVDVTWLEIESYQAWLLNDKGCTSGTAATYMSSVRALYRYMEKIGLVRSNPTKVVPPPKVYRPLPRNIMSRAEIKRLLSAPDIQTYKGVMHRTILELLYGTAIRLAEVCGLQVSDVYFLRDELRVKGKGSKFRIQPLSETVSAWLHIYIEKVRPELIADENETFLFVGANRGRPINSQVLSEMVRRYAKIARINKAVSTHTIRATTATHMLKQGASLPSVQAILGHKWMSTTERYTKVVPNEMLRHIRRFHPRDKDLSNEKK